MAETTNMELDLLQRRAWTVGCYVNRHRNWDPLSDTGGDLYLMDRKTRQNPKPETIIKFSTVQQIEDALTIIERERFSRLA